MSTRNPAQVYLQRHPRCKDSASPRRGTGAHGRHQFAPSSKLDAQQIPSPATSHPHPGRDPMMWSLRKPFAGAGLRRVCQACVK